MSLNFVVNGFENANQGGSSRLYGIGQSDRYLVIRESMLAGQAFDRTISSILTYAPSTGDAVVILFANATFNTPLDDFGGDFFQITMPAGSPDQSVNLSSFGFDDKTQSLLLVNTNKRPEFRFSFRDAFLSKWNQTVDAQLGGSATRNGDPIMMWTPFPASTSHLDPTQIYLTISQRLTIHLGWWPDYDARMAYNLFLSIDSATGKLTGHVQRWYAWVEGGVKSGEIMNHLWPKVVDGVRTITIALRAALANIPMPNSIYYLPGRQLASLSGISAGNTFDDVTIVLD